ncbi:MAG: carboxypeptidase-like regulatory domain-containing protein [bacterium]
MKEKKIEFNPCTLAVLLLVLFGVQCLSIAEANPFIAQVANSYDDAEETASGNIYRTNTKLQLVYDSAYDDYEWFKRRGNQTVGLRFTDINIPKNATITNAYLEFTANGSSSGTTNLTITVQEADDPPTFSTSDNDISSRISSDPTAISWSIVESWSDGETKKSPDISELVQSLVNRSKWENFNAMVFIITGTGKRNASSFDSQSSPPLLYVEYTEGGSSGAKVTGRIYYNGSGVGMAQVTLYGSAVGKTYTDENGDYMFDNLGSGDITIVPEKAGFAFYPQSKEVTTNSGSTSNANFGVVWTYDGTVEEHWISAPLVDVYKPYPATAIELLGDKEQFLILRDGLFWYLNQDGDWSISGDLKNTWDNANVPKVNGYVPTENISAQFYIESTKQLTIVRSAIQPMYWTYDWDINGSSGGWVDSGYLINLWGTAPEVNGSNLYEDGGPTAVTYLKEFDAYFIVKNDVYWLRKNNSWIKSGTLSSLFKDAPTAITSGCDEQPIDNITGMFYISDTDMIAPDYGQRITMISETCTNISNGASWTRHLYDEYNNSTLAPGPDGIPDMFISQPDPDPQPYLHSISISCDDVSQIGSLKVGESLGFSAICRDQNNDEMNNVSLHWTILPTVSGTIASGNNSMTLTATIPGTYTLQVSCNGIISNVISGNILGNQYGETVALDVPITGSYDDAEETESGAIFRTNTKLQLVYDSTADWFVPRGNQTVGLRFVNVDIPKNATITNAYLEFSAYGSDSGTTNLKITVQAADDPPTFSTSSNNISSRIGTNPIEVNWNSVESWTDGTSYKSPEIKFLVQSLVNRSGWIEGNAMVFIITGTGKRASRSIDSISSKAPLLHVEYQTGGSDTDPTSGPSTVKYYYDDLGRVFRVVNEVN